jgi:YtoQ family protein
MELNVYLSGEIHTDWREKLKQGCEENNLSIIFTSAVTDHEASDSAGDILGGYCCLNILIDNQHE